MPKRFIWIDLMKVFGMYCIVWGHFFSIGHKYLYIFNVPLFFIISGFLSKKESNCRVFWNKILNNFFIPLFIISSINFFIHTISAFLHGTLYLHEIYSFPFLVLIGQWYQLGGMWFVYTLIVLKVILQFLPIKKSSLFCICLFLFGLLISLKNYNYYLFGIDFSVHPNSILNICTAFPFFLIGYLLKKYSDRLDMFNNFKYFLMGGLLICIVFLCGYYNNFVWMYKNQFGNNFLLFLIGGFAGTALIYLISKLIILNKKYLFYIQTLARGMILILGFQMIFIKIFIHLFPTRSLLDTLFSLFIMIIFIPIILFVEKFFPILLGNRKISKITEN